MENWPLLLSHAVDILISFPEMIPFFSLDCYNATEKLKCRIKAFIAVYSGECVEHGRLVFSSFSVCVCVSNDSSRIFKAYSVCSSPRFRIAYTETF